MYCRDELFLRSLECYFCVYFPRCFATREINTKITSRERWNSSSPEYIRYSLYLNHMSSYIDTTRLIFSSQILVFSHRRSRDSSYKWTMQIGTTPSIICKMFTVDTPYCLLMKTWHRVSFSVSFVSIFFCTLLQGLKIDKWMDPIARLVSWLWYCDVTQTHPESCILSDCTQNVCKGWTWLHSYSAVVKLIITG